MMRNFTRRIVNPVCRKFLFSTGSYGKIVRVDSAKVYSANYSVLLLLGITSLFYANSQEMIEANCDRDDYERPLSRNFVADVVDVVSPAVVNIVCPAGFGSASSGSGFFISKDGTIVTNAHVVAPSMDGTVVITMKNGKKRPGKIHSMDTQSDLAIVQMQDFGSDMIPTVQFGVSSKVRSGEFVIAIGSPMHLQDSASLGIVSATARHASELGISNNRSEYIQTDAAINMGNSGGPLVNLDGEVIGINTMKVKGTDGISFAIPVDIASQIIKQLLTNKRVIRPFVGLKMANMVTPTESSNKYLRRRPSHVSPHLSDNQKVVVLDVIKDSPASNAGIMSGDVIIEVNGKKVTGVRDILDAIGLEVGKVIDFKIQRGNDQDVTARLITAPEGR